MHRQEDSHEVEMKMQEGRIRGRRVLPREQEQVIVKGNSEPCHEQATFCVAESTSELCVGGYVESRTYRVIFCREGS